MGRVDFCSVWLWFDSVSLVRLGLVWFLVFIWFSSVWFSLVLFVPVRFLVQFGSMWYSCGSVWFQFGVVQFSLMWFGVVWFGLVWFRFVSPFLLVLVCVGFCS